MYRDLREYQQVFTDFAVSVSDQPIRLTIEQTAGDAVRVDNVRVSKATGNYFRLLGISPLAGRFFTPDEDRGTNSSETAGSVIVLSYSFWQRQFGGDPRAIGRTVLVDRSPCRIIGVAPRGFMGERVGSSPDGWVPLVPFTPTNELEGRRGTFGFRFARLKPGVSLAHAQTAMTALFQRLLTAEGIITDDIQSRGILLRSASAGVRTLIGITYLTPLRIVMAVAVLVLLIACANIANLLIARGARRHGEIGVRLAIGCSRGRLNRQLLTESLVLSFIGAIAGVAFAYWGTTLLLQMVNLGGDPVWIDGSPDWRVLLFLLGMAVITGIGFGIAPALRTSRLAPASPLVSSAGRGATRTSQRVGHTLVTIQIALSLLLLVGAGLLVGSLQNLNAIERGFASNHVVLVDLQHTPRRTDPASLSRVAEDVQMRVSAIPGVESASVSCVLLFSGRDQRARLEIAGFTPPSSGRESVGFIDENGIPRARFNLVSPDYFRTVGMTLVEGRGIESRDGSAAPHVAVVNESMARAYFASVHAVGRTFVIPTPPAPNEPIEIVGVVRDAKYNSLREAMRPMFYLPLAQSPRSWSTPPSSSVALRSLEIRTRQPLGALSSPVRQALADVAPDIMIKRFVALSDQVDQSVSAERLIMRLSSFFGVVALLLACIGLYGVLAYSVTQRTSEIGVRLALGATPRAIMRLVLGNSATMVLTGVALGLLLAVGATRWLASFLYGVTPTDAGTFASAIALLVATASAAALIPSWRATRVDPTVALRD
jgi:predicted permease